MTPKEITALAEEFADTTVGKDDRDTDEWRNCRSDWKAGFLEAMVM